MTDEQLIKYLGIENEPKALRAIGLFTPERRAVYERMAGLETELHLWQDGLGPKPQGILIDTERSTHRRKTQKQIDRAMLEVTALSHIAKSAGDLPTYYAANRARHELFKAREDRSKRATALANGERT